MPPATDSLNKLYVEVTTACNLDCEMCIRHVWDEPTGTMPLATFRRLMEQVSAMPEPPIIHFGGYGEPLTHRHFLEMVELAKTHAAAVEVTTNGTRLKPAVADALIELDLDRLVVSIDSTHKAAYAGSQNGTGLAQVIDNLVYLKRRRFQRGGKHANPQVGIAFVATRSNIHELPELPWLATRIGAWEIIVTNLVPHTPDLQEEVLYSRSLTTCAYRASKQVVDMSLPKIDIDPVTVPPLHQTFNSTASISLLDSSLSGRNDYCKFTQEGYAAVRWDGEVAPCLPLLHDHPEYIHGRRKLFTHHSFGNINDQHLRMIWQSPAYTDYRTRLREFQFSPCTTCGGCERFPRNLNDCMENTFPVCGGCLWAQGFVQCP